MFDLKRFRIDKKIGQKDLAELFECKQSYISALETGRRTINGHQIGLLQNNYGNVSDYILADSIIERGTLKEDKSIVEMNVKGCGVPVYDIDVTCGFDSQTLINENIIGYIDLPYIRKDGRHIVSATGESMYPMVKDGDKIVVKELESWDFLYFGQIYIVVTDDFRMMKYVHKHPTDEAKVILKSENKHYDDMDLPKKLIKKLFIVENVLSIKTMM